MIELVIVSRLLEYPDAALWQHQQEMFEAIAASKNLSKEDAHALGIFLRDLTAMDPLDAQASTANCSTVAAPRHCCYLNMFTVNPVTAARRWWTCWRSTSSTVCS